MERSNERAGLIHLQQIKPDGNGIFILTKCRNRGNGSTGEQGLGSFVAAESPYSFVGHPIRGDRR